METLKKTAQKPLPLHQISVKLCSLTLSAGVVHGPGAVVGAVGDPLDELRPKTTAAPCAARTPCRCTPVAAHACARTPAARRNMQPARPTSCWQQLSRLIYSSPHLSFIIVSALLVPWSYSENGTP
jgi:hypothetical protein